MGWADVIEGVLGIAPKRLVQTALLVLLAFMALTGNVTPILWWMQERASSMTTWLLPVLTAATTPS